jgi:hypothetical protein
MKRSPTPMVERLTLPLALEKMRGGKNEREKETVDSTE